METNKLWILYIITNLTTWIFLLCGYLYQTNRKLQIKKGYSEEYINFRKKDSRTRIFSIALFIPVLQLGAAFIVWMIAGELSIDKHLGYILLVFIILVIPFPIMDMKDSNQKHKDLAIQTRTSIYVDFNYKTLHLIFKPVLEFASLIIIVFYNFFFLNNNIVIYIYLVLVWGFYLLFKSGKNQIRQMLKDGYQFFFIYHIFFQLIIILAITLYTFEVQNQKNFWVIWPLDLLLLGKIIYYFFKLPEFRKKLKK